jgi:hypothetical protein
MASHLDPNSPTGASDTPTPLSDGARTVISLLLFVHLFAISLAFCGNFEGAEFDPKPGLIPRMEAVVRPYLYPLWLDRPFQYHLTYGAPLDFDHFLEVAINANQPGDQPAILQLPDADAGPSLSANRYRRLAWHVARRAQMPDGGDLLPLAVGAGVLKQYDSRRVQVRCFRQQPLFLDALDGSATSPMPSADERVYAADVFFLPGNDQPQLNKIGEARDFAPVTGPAPSGGRQPAGKADSKSSATKPTDPAAGLRNPLLPQNNGSASGSIPPALPPDLK